MIKLKLIIFIFIIANAEVAAFDFIRGNSSAIGGCSVMSQAGASELLSVPTTALDNGSGKIELGINRLHNMKEFDRIYFASAYRISKFSFALGFSQQGESDLYTEKIARLSSIFHLDSVSIGVNLSLMNVGFNEHYPSVSGLSVGVGGSYRHKYFAAAMTIDDANSPRLDNLSKKNSPRLNLFGEYLGRSSYSITARISIQSDEKPQYGIGQKIKLSSLASILWGVSTNPTVYGGGLEINYRMTKISYNSSYHPVLGLSQNIYFEYSI